MKKLTILWKNRDAVFCVAMAAILAASSYMAANGLAEFSQTDENTFRVFFLVRLAMLCSAAALILMACYMRAFEIKKRKKPMATKKIDRWA